MEHQNSEWGNSALIRSHPFSPFGHEFCIVTAVCFLEASNVNLECHITNSSDSGHFEMIIYLITLFLFPMSLILVSFIMNVLFLNQTNCRCLQGRLH